MTQEEPPSWYVPGNLFETVRAAADHQGVSTRDIAATLEAREFEAPSDRLVQLVETTRERLPLQEDSGDPSLEDPRAVPSRIVGVEDVRYLNRRDFALLVGTALSRYDGHFRTPDEAGDVAIDLIWNRQHTTLVFVTIPKSPGSPVERNNVKEVVGGGTHPDYIRSPSVVGIVSPGHFTEEAQQLAASNDLDLFGATHIDKWLTDASLPFDIVGQVLERGTMTSEEIGGLLEQIEPLPQRRQENDPLAEPSSLADQSAEDLLSTADSDDKIVEESERPEADSGESEPEKDSSPLGPDDHATEQGKFGELYADPDEDGEYDAFDQFADELSDSQ